MTDARDTVARRTAFSSTAALVGGAVMIASLGAVAGWMMNDARTGVVEPVPARHALAPNEVMLPPSLAPDSGTSLAAPAVVAPAVPATPLVARDDASIAHPQPVPATPEVRRPAPARETRVAQDTPRRAERPARVGDTSSGSGSERYRPRPSDTAHERTAERRADREVQRVGVCERCGTVEDVREVRQLGSARGVGAVTGGVLGGLIGSQIGKGNGRNAMTVIGMVGGGVAGHEIEKRVKAETVYEVQVRMDDGRTRTVTQKTAPATGARVVVDGDSLRTVSRGGADGDRT